MRQYLKKNIPSFYRPAARVFRWASQLTYNLVSKHPKKWVVIKAVVTGAPAAVLSFATLRLPSKAPGQDSLLLWLGEHWMAVVAIILWPLIVQVLFALIEWVMDETKNQIIVERTRFITLYTALEEVVGKKAKRFGDYCHKLRIGKASRSKAVAFDEVTDPEHQIELLVEAAFEVLKALHCKPGDVNGTIKVVLVELENNQPVRFRAHLPNHTAPSSSMFAEEKCRKTTWARAAQDGKPIVIQDIALHLSSKGPKDKKYLASGDPGADCGSITAIPIIHPQSMHTPFVLSFKSSEPNKITEDMMKELRPVISAFQNRLLLEYNIQFIKENTHANA